MKILTFFLCLLFSCGAFSQDGDSFVLPSKALCNSIPRGEKIRLHSIDCPELSQVMGNECKNYTESVLKRAKTISVKRILYVDKYGRKIVELYVDGKDLSHLLVKNGMAFCHPKYCKNINFWEAEAAAKKNKLGIHKYNIVKPWLYRWNKK